MISESGTVRCHKSCTLQSLYGADTQMPAIEGLGEPFQASFLVVPLPIQDDPYALHRSVLALWVHQARSGLQNGTRSISKLYKHSIEII